jgi:hypothetical protein
MPEISRFFGISIKMFYGDHAPPHFHAVYGEHKARIDVHALVVIGGYLPHYRMPKIIDPMARLRSHGRIDPSIRSTPCQNAD